MNPLQRKTYIERLKSLPWSRSSEVDEEEEDDLDIDTVESLSVNKGPLVEVMRLQQICSHALLSVQEEGSFPQEIHLEESSSKLIFLKQLLKHLFECPKQRLKNHRIVIMSRSRRFLDIISHALIIENKYLKTRYARVDGMTCTDPAERAHVFRRFNRTSSELRVLLMTTQVGGVGVGLSTKR
jgi:SNF2 family DNA or RNA helicase